MNKEEAIRIFRKEIECLSHAKCEDCILEKVCDPAKTTPLDSEYIEAYGMAIQALSQEPCDDAISREAVLDALLDYWHDIQFVDGSGYDVYEDCKAVIDDLPSVTHKSGKWISVRERLPEDAQEVLYSTKTGRVFHGEYYDDNTDRKWFSYKDDMFSFNNVVKAWMPLPKPYESQERSDKE